MAELVSCSHCGRVNRLPSVGGSRKGYFRCGACSTTVKRTAAHSAAASDGKVLDAEFTHYEISLHLVGVAWLSVIALILGFTSMFDPFYGAIRVLPFAASAYATYLVFQIKRTPWIWLMGGLTFFYNPLIVSLLDRVSWVMIDVAAILVLAAAPFYCPVADKSQASRKRMRANIAKLSDAHESQV
jgi:hypothetical protein